MKKILIMIGLIVAGSTASADSYPAGMLPSGFVFHENIPVNPKSRKVIFVEDSFLGRFVSWATKYDWHAQMEYGDYYCVFLYEGKKTDGIYIPKGSLDDGNFQRSFEVVRGKSSLVPLSKTGATAQSDEDKKLLEENDDLLIPVPGEPLIEIRGTHKLTFLKDSNGEPWKYECKPLRSKKQPTSLGQFATSLF